MLKRLLFVCCLLVVGCSEPPMRGVIVKKNHRPAWTSYVPMRVGKVTMIVPQHHPEQWDVVIQADGTGDDEGQHLVVVTEGYWDDCEVGDVWQRADTVYED